MAKLPADVERLRQKLPKHPGIREELGEAACKLLNDSPELAAMWRAIERRSEKRDPWVAIFLGFVKEASQLPPFHYVSAEDRRRLGNRIQRLSGELTKLLDENELTEHLIFSNGKMFHGFFFYEDFGESNRARIDQAGEVRLKISDVIRESAKRSRERIKEEPGRGKVGRNVRAVRFARMVAERNLSYYGEKLYSVTATATNAVYGTDYSESDISNLMVR